MPFDFPSLLRDIRSEKSFVARVYETVVTSSEMIDARIARVSFRSNRLLDVVKDSLEGGKAWPATEAEDGAHQWRILGVGDDQGEADVLYLLASGIVLRGPQVNEKLKVQLFNFVEPVLASLSVDDPAHWRERTAQAMRWMTGEEAPSLIHRGDPVFRADVAPGWNAQLGCIWGPPGTGKTWTLGQQVAKAALAGKRVLVTSTTNDATDVAAAEIMNALRQAGGSVVVKRVGSGLRHGRFNDPTVPKLYHPSVLPEDDPEMVKKIEDLVQLHERASTTNEKITLRRQILELRRELGDHATRYLLDETCRVVVTTGYTAVARLVGTPTRMTVRDRAEQGPLFDSLCVDEAGLVSAPMAAALAPYSKTRIVLFGDPRQLGPIARVSKELRRSCLAAIARPGQPTTTVLREQRRMDPPIRAVVSGYTYADAPLADAGLEHRKLPVIPAELGAGQLKIVFMDDAVTSLGRPIPLSALGAERGPEGKSYQRTGTGGVLQSMLEAYPALEKVRCAFISPFRSQVRFIRRALTSTGPGARLSAGHTWTFTTVHAQQGGEAPLVLFDTVDLTKVKDWQVANRQDEITEWQRLLNVALSRGQRTVLVLTTRQEWRASNQAHVKRLREVVDQTAGPGAYVTWHAAKRALVPVHPTQQDPLLRAPVPRVAGSFGERIETLAANRPVLTAEQRRLTEGTALDGPWMVRGAPGSGKTLALAEWAVRTKADNMRANVGIVHYTEELGEVITREVMAAGQRLGLQSAANAVRIEWFHSNRIAGPRHKDDWQGETKSRERRLARPAPRYGALFVDEAQDFGPEGIQYLSALTEGRNLRLLLDPMQATGDLTVTDWAAYGFTEERTTVLRESHRSTRQIADMAMNLFAALGGDTRSMVKDELVVPVRTVPLGRKSVEVLSTDFVEHEGPNVVVRSFEPGVGKGNTRANELDWVAREIDRLLREEDLRPSDIGVVANPIYLLVRGKETMAAGGLVNTFHSGLEERLSSLAFGRGFKSAADAIPVYGLGSVKGLEFEVVFMVGADTLAPHPRSQRQSRAPDLYTAATRARQKLIITGTRFPTGTDKQTGVNVLQVAEALSGYLASDEFREGRKG